MFCVISADASFCNWTRISVCMINFLTYCRRTDDLRYALSSSAGVGRGKTSRVCRKSPDNIMNAPPKNCSFPLKYFSVQSSASNDFFFVSYCAFVSYDKFTCLSNLSIPKMLMILHVGISVVYMFNNNFIAECAIRPPFKSVSAIPDDKNFKWNFIP